MPAPVLGIAQERICPDPPQLPDSITDLYGAGQAARMIQSLARTDRRFLSLRSWNFLQAFSIPSSFCASLGPHDWISRGNTGSPLRVDGRGVDFYSPDEFESVGMIAALDFEKPFPFGAIRVPPVRLKGGRLYYRPQGQLPLASGRPDRLVFDFARLATAPEQGFSEFAQQWGVLGLCPHDKSIHHLVSPLLPQLDGRRNDRADQ